MFLIDNDLNPDKHPGIYTPKIALDIVMPYRIRRKRTTVKTMRMYNIVRHYIIVYLRFLRPEPTFP